MNKLKAVRLQSGLTQKQVAQHIGVSVPTVSEWESGKKHPSAKNYRALADLYKVTVDYLMSEDAAWDLAIEKARDDEIAETLYRRPGMRVLFDAVKDTPDEILQQAINIVEVLKNAQKK